MSSIIYHVTIDALEKENVFRINWIDRENTVHTFEQSASAIAPEEMEWMWKDRRNQLKIGEKLFHFLDGHDHHLKQALKDSENHSETLQIHLTTCRETANWPFELLALQGSFLLPKHVHLVRLIPVQESIKELPPQSRHLKLLFMACSPLDVQKELDFEQEEDGIFKAVEKLAVDMDIEDTGSLAGLREKLEQQTYDIVHLSGYAGIDKKGQPFFIMESETGCREEVPAAKLWHEGLKANPPRMLFLSGSSTGDAPGEIENVFARILVEKYHIPAVLGWGQWISDSEANKAAEIIYKDLTRGKSLLDAIQRARYELYNFSKAIKPSWPQLRLFSSGGSLGAIVTEEQKTQPQVRRMTHAYLRNSEIKVLAEGFVGRRRQLQQSIHILKLERGKIGLLILGTGGLGKSCLAGKISERFKEHTLISLHGKLNSISLKRALKDAFIISQDEHGKQVLTWEKEMKEIVGVLCRSCFKDRKYLILLDDFEQNLEGWEKGEPGGLLPEAAELLKALLDNLPGSEKMTRMIITSRYGFTLHQESFQTSKETNVSIKIKSFSGGQGGRLFKKAPLDKADLINEKLELIWLPGFREVEQKKKVRALPHILKQTEPTIVDKLLAAGCGNPRLMEWLDVLVGELEKAKAGVTELLQAVRGKKQEFIQKHVINELLDLGGEELTVFLRWFAIYRRPVLKEGAREVGEKAGLQAWEDLLYRGMDLSLVEHDEARFSYQGTPLLREDLLNKLQDHRPCHEAAFAYYKSICEGKPDEQFDPVQTEEWIFHALGCGEEEVATHEGGKLVNYLGESLAIFESRRVGLWILEKKKIKRTTKDDAFLLGALAYWIKDLGHHQDAIGYIQEALTIWKYLYGEMHKEVANTLNNLGEVWRIFGEPKKAMYYFQEAVATWKSTCGDRHPQVAIGLNNLGTSYRNLRDYPRAIDYYQDAVTILKNFYGERHPQVAIGFINLGEVCGALGEYQKAITYYQDALTILKHFYGETHPLIALGLGNLGIIWETLGDYHKAMEYFQEALAIDEEVFGTDHYNVAREFTYLGNIWINLGDYRKAITYYEKGLSIDEKVIGREHPNVANRLNSLGTAWKMLDNQHKAIAYFQDALAILKKVYGDKHDEVATTLNNLGSAWDDLSDHRRAIDYFQNALNIWKSIYGKIHPNVANAFNNLGLAWKGLGKNRKALTYYRKSLKIKETIFGREHPSVATGLSNLGFVWKALGKNRKALIYYLQALIIDEKVLGRKHPSVASELNNIGLVWDNLGDYMKAIEYFQQALRIDEEVFGQEHSRVARDFSNLGKAYFNMGQWETAKDYFEQAYSIYKKYLGEDHLNTKLAKTNLEVIAKIV